MRRASSVLLESCEYSAKWVSLSEPAICGFACTPTAIAHRKTAQTTVRCAMDREWPTDRRACVRSKGGII